MKWLSLNKWNLVYLVVLCAYYCVRPIIRFLSSPVTLGVHCTVRMNQIWMLRNADYITFGRIWPFKMSIISFFGSSLLWKMTAAKQHVILLWRLNISLLFEMFSSYLVNLPCFTYCTHTTNWSHTMTPPEVTPTFLLNIKGFTLPNILPNSRCNQLAHHHPLGNIMEPAV